MSDLPTVTLADIEEAREVLRGVAVETPMEESRWLSALAGGPVSLKCENLQRTGSFKARGGYLRLSRLSEEERSHGVVAASAGNHAQGVALAAQLLGIKATVFMPEGAPIPKEKATRGYGAEVIFHGRYLENAIEAALAFSKETGAVFIHPFDHPDIVAGQGTVGLEILEQSPDVKTVLVPTGGGGLLAGIAIAVKALRPDVRIVGVQAANCAPLAGSTEVGFTIADGIAVKQPGELTSGILADLLDDVVTVTDDEIAQAIVLLLERVKLVVEGGGAASVAALLGGKVRGEDTACALLSGGNIDASLLMEVARYGLTRGGRFLVVRTQVRDRPGALATLLTRLAEEHVNIHAVEHHREGMEIPLAVTEVELTLATRDHQHCEELLERMREWGYPSQRLR
jgi:threonine dehydratase